MFNNFPGWVFPIYMKPDLKSTYLGDSEKVYHDSVNPTLLTCIRKNHGEKANVFENWMRYSRNRFCKYQTKLSKTGFKMATRKIINKTEKASSLQAPQSSKTAVLLATPKCPQCVPNVSPMRPQCVLKVSPMRPQCIPNASWMRPQCAPKASPMCPQIFPKLSPRTP